MTRGVPRGRGPARIRSRLGNPALLLSLVVAAAGSGCGFVERDGPPTDAWLTINGQEISVEIADTPRKQELGLGERDALPWDHGMYFEYERPAFYAFWMKGMRFSIDIVWLRNDRIVGIESNVPFEPGTNGPTLRPPQLVDAVLEVPADYAAARGWRIGDRIHLSKLTEK